MFWGSKPKKITPISVHEIEDAQQAWGQSIVAIATAHAEGGDARAAAEKHVDELYAYNHSAVLFKPTKVTEWQFRGAREDALSYFVGGEISEDKGFALHPWSDVKFENAGFNTDGDTALAMGNYYFTDTSGQTVKVEYSFGYQRDDTGKLRIVLHHSSLPYSG